MTSRNLNVEFRTKSSKALNSQFPIDNYGHPFTLNPTIGCFFGCKYCYSPIFVAKVLTQKRKQFFENVAVKLNIAEYLDKELTKFAVLPQHLKRVQINETSDYYLPQVMNSLEKIHNRDIMLEILQVFEKHWNNGNKWMLHILTKSHLILKHLDQLKNMRNMVQVEFSISNIDEQTIRSLEFYTPTIKKRLKTIDELAKNNIFVRIMAMPYYGTRKDVENIKKITFNHGAIGFKNKGINYYEWAQLKPLSYDDLINDKIARSSGRSDPMIEDLNEKSGELMLFNGKAKISALQFPNVRQWDTVTKLNQKLSNKNLEHIDCGYSSLNTVDWGYIH